MKPSLVYIPGKDTVSEALGISSERLEEVKKQAIEIAKGTIDVENARGDHAKAIVEIWNAFEDPAECAFALFALDYEEHTAFVEKVEEMVGE